MVPNEPRESAAVALEAIDLLVRRLQLLAAGMSETARSETLLGLAQLLNKVVPRASHALLRGRWMAVPVPGGRMFSDLGEWTTLELLAGGGWETPLLPLCRAHVAPGQTVMDVGAHTGSYTVLFASLVGQRGRVYAFEPHPENVEQLGRTVAINEIGRIAHIEQTALSDRGGVAELYAYAGAQPADGARYEGESSMLHSLTRADGYEATGVEVPVTTLDSFADAHAIRSVDFIKIDAEGAEERILAGGRELIARSPRIALLVELHPAELGAQGRAVEDVADLLHAQGLELTDISCDGGELHRRPLAPRGKVEGTHLLAARGG